LQSATRWRWNAKVRVAGRFAFFGDGGTEEGVFYESLNFAHCIVFRVGLSARTILCHSYTYRKAVGDAPALRARGNVRMPARLIEDPMF